MFCLVAAAESFMLEELEEGVVGDWQHMLCPLSHDGSVFRACRGRWWDGCTQCICIQQVLRATLLSFG